MTRKQKRELFVTFHYHNGNLRRNKRKYTNIFSNFLNTLKHAFTKGH